MNKKYCTGFINGSLCAAIVLGGSVIGIYSSIQEECFALIILMAITITALLYVMVSALIIKRSNESVVRQNSLLSEQVRILIRSVGCIQTQYQSAEKINKAKSKFLNRVSHDLRTPMNAIVGYSMLMEQMSDEPQKVKYYTDRIILSGHALTELINDVLDMGSIEAGKVKLVKNNFSLKSVFEEVNAAVIPQSRNCGQNFNFYMNNETGVDMIVGDKQRLCQVLRNLLSNAVKYTPEGGTVDLIVNVIRTSDESVHMLCQIKDTGCGMSREFIETLFDPFEREENEMDMRYPGTGLGMCIAKSFVDLMQGTITVESKPGTGSLITVNLPLTPADGEMGGPWQVLDDKELLKGLRILAAEDNESNAEILYEVLTAMGAECVVTGDGQEAVEAFEASDTDAFDIILLDIQMPVMNGYQAAAAIRKSKHPAAKDIAIVAMTADAFEEDVQRAFVCGMNAHVAKPLDLKRFIDTVESLNICKKEDLTDKR